MSDAFLWVFNRSIAVSWLILAVVLLRLVLRRAPRRIVCLLWGVVALRLILPFSIPSPWSLIPSTQTVPADIALEHTPTIRTGIPAVNEAINPVLAQSFSPDPFTSANPLQILIPCLAAVWIAGMVFLLAGALVSTLRLRRRVAARVAIGENTYICDEAEFPFLLGVLRPTIYLPSTLDDASRAFVLAHERAHVRRGDHGWKLLAYLLLTVHWFNPLCWLGYILLGRDMEMACDERVIRDMDREGRAAYSDTLLTCSLPRRSAVICPLAFGEVGVKQRIRNILRCRKPAVWSSAAALVVCAMVAVCFLTDRQDSLRLVRSDTLDHVWFEYELDIGRTVTGGRMAAEHWQNGTCVSAAPVVFDASAGKLTVAVYPHREEPNGPFTGFEVQCYTDKTTLICPELFPVEGEGRAIGYAVSGPERGKRLRLTPESEFFLAAVSIDSGSGAYSMDYEALERVKDAPDMIVVRVTFPEGEDLFHAYTENADGTFRADNGIDYLYLRTLWGRSHNASCDSWFTVLTNDADLTFERVNESMISSSSESWLAPEDTIILAMGVEGQTPPV